MPGDNEKALAKSSSLPADMIVFDLEDAVAPAAKDTARSRIVEVINSGTHGPRELVVRVNSQDTVFFDDDIRSVAESGADGILLPKVNSASDVRRALEAFDTHGVPADVYLWTMIETPAAFLHAEEIASANERLVGFVIGTNDLVHDLNAVHVPGRGPLIPILTLALLGAKAAGKAILDGVFNNIRDEDGLVTEATQGRQLGFDGKTVVHPSQVGPVNSAFSPTPSEVAYARAVVDAYSEAERTGSGVVVVDGKMVEHLHVRTAERVLELDRIFQQPLTTQVS